jgi:hypothetical protein
MTFQQSGPPINYRYFIRKVPRLGGVVAAIAAPLGGISFPLPTSTWAATLIQAIVARSAERMT